MKEETIKTVDTILARGHRVLLVPIKDGERIFEINQKEARPEKRQN